jgi:hypothetical protein
MVDASVWDREIGVPEDVISFVDSNVIESKPCGFLSSVERVVSAFFFERPICAVGTD